MLTYKCDACGCMIDDPHDVKMKEFYVGCESTISGHPLPIDVTRKTKIHICDECFKGLNLIAEKAMKGEKKC